MEAADHARGRKRVSATPIVTGPKMLAYETAKALAVDPDAAVRVELAGRADMRPELLYYMADDDDPAVRAAVAGNDLTPIQASPRLARDRSADVRAVLAGKLARSLPHLTAEEHAAMHDLAVNALMMLAADQAVRVRTALATAIKDVDCAPPKLVAMLARDVAREVAEPVLRTCALLSDEDLLGIIAAHPVPWVLEAISRRPTVSAADAVLAEGDAGASAALSDNPGADLSAAADAGEVILRGAPDPTLPVGRAALPPEITAKLADFVEDGMRGALADSGAFDGETGDEIADVARRRLDFARDYSSGERPEARALRLFQAGALGEEAVWDALSWGDLAFVRAGLALMTRTPASVIQRVLDTQSAKAVTALAWKAGLSMRGARLLQQKAAGIHPRRILNARHGTDYPLSEEELQFQLDLFGIGE